ncbi:unnamed protein product [Calypogeia fissa]
MLGIVPNLPFRNIDSQRASLELQLVWTGGKEPHSLSNFFSHEGYKAIALVACLERVSPEFAEAHCSDPGVVLLSRKVLRSSSVAVKGSLNLLGGDPGVDKSPLLLQIAGLLALEANDDPAPVLNVSGEESVQQISDRADRMQIGAHELFFYSATDLELVLKAIQELKPRAVVVDSTVQTVYLPKATGSAGTVIQVRECAAAMLR